MVEGLFEEKSGEIVPLRKPLVAFHPYGYADGCDLITSNKCRLDENGSDTDTDFRKHVFFSQMDWNQIEARSIDAPIITTTRDRKTRDQI